MSKCAEAMSVTSRRKFLGAAAATGATLGAGLAPWQISRSIAAEPRKGGTLRFCRPDSPDTLDPQVSNSFCGYEYSKMVYDNLVWLDADDQPQPQLATSWTPEQRGQEWVVTLREGVKFHNGADFTSADVIASVERSLDRARSGAGFGCFGPVKAIQAEGPLKVRFILNLPFGEFAANLAEDHCRILPAKGIDDLRTSPNGTGPFVFKDFQPGSSLTVERNPNYWDPSVVFLDGVRMVFIHEAVSMQAALRAGQVDLITQIPVETYLVMQKAQGLHAYSATTGDHQTCQLMGNMAPFDNMKVRQAFHYLLDREALVTAALFGQGTVGNDIPLPAGNFYLPQLPQYKQDLPKAKKLIEESGVGPITLDIYGSSERPPQVKMCLAFSEAAAKIGVTLNVRDVPYTEYAANVARKKPMFTSNWGGSATLFDAIYKKYYSKGFYNYSNIECAPGLDAKLDDMIAEVDTAKRKVIAADVLSLVHEYSDRLVPYFKNYIGITNDKVNGFVPPKFGVIETRKMWLAA
jgi:peptide/nickel transport system substrate-binding protein